MSEALETNVTELADSRVRLEVQVAPAEVQAKLEGKARQLGRELKLPGFRRGKVPAPLVIQRVGREAVLDQAVRDALSGWYAKAIEQASVVPVGDPQIDLSDLPGDGQPLAFSIEIGVLPTAQLGDYEGLEVPRREPVAEEQQIDAEIEGMRERLARLETAERAAAEGDFVVIDYVGSLVESGGEESGEDAAAERRLVAFEGGEGRDQLVELGGGNLIPGFEEALVGASAGEQREVALTFPDDYPAEQLAGREAVFAVTVKEVKLKQLPEIDEDFAIDAGFDSVQELREDIRRRLLEADEPRVEGEFREAALDAAVAQASVALTPELVAARAKEMWERMLHTLSHRGISRETYLQISGRDEQDLLSEMEPDAERALRREAVLTAIVAAERIEPSEQELLEAIEPTAEREGVEATKLLADLRSAGRLDELREDLAARKAIELIAERAEPISVEQAQAREQLWTPGQEPAPEGAVAGGAGG
ncbi:MAG TPA: trigger factor, partial [Solirubrobacteraceae bacterium]|nr:trigger factor [Solirubrobacteraceae bacterium]